MPTFCENVVNGIAPNIAAIAELNPSNVNAPPNSLPVGFLPKPALHNAVVSPIASTIATIKQIHVNTHGTTSNLSFEKSNTCGKSNIPCGPISALESIINPLKSTIPGIQQATIYPTAIPTMILMFFHTPLINKDQRMETVIVTKATMM